MTFTEFALSPSVRSRRYPQFISTMASDSSDSEAEQVSKPKRSLKRKREEDGSDDDESSGNEQQESEVNSSKFRINPLNVIKNKEIRKKLYKKQQQQKKKLQKRSRRQRKEEGGPRSELKMKCLHTVWSTNESQMLIFRHWTHHRKFEGKGSYDCRES